MTAEPLLEVVDLSVRYGGVVAVESVTFTVDEGHIAGLIGPNGAGKTSCIDALAGFHPAHRGVVRFAGADVTALPPHVRARRGFSRTFQGLDLFEDLTVRQNLAVGAATPTWRDTLTDALWPKRHRHDDVDEALDLVGLADLAERHPTDLSNGQRHLVALARAITARPRLLLLDEPAAGLDETESVALGALLRRLPGRGTTVLLVDHDMSLVLSVCDRVHVLDVGRLIASGTPTEVRADPEVIAAYLGTEAATGPDDPGRGCVVMDPVLELSGLDAGYGGVPVVHGVDLAVRPGEVLVLLGANGAGKSTTLLTVSGLLPVLGGEVRFAGTPVSTGGRRSLARAAALARDGLVHVPEDRGLFPDLTVAEHLRITRTRDGGPDRDDVVARFPALDDLLDRRAGLLSGGEQQMLALARGLLAGPRVLLVDELSLGLAPLVVSSLLPMLRDVADDSGVGVVLVEQHVRLALDVADHAVVLRRGRVALAGTAVEVSARLADVEADYFGDGPAPGPAGG